MEAEEAQPAAAAASAAAAADASETPAGALDHHFHLYSVERQQEVCV